MRIGVDLDGVVYDSEKEFRVYAELYDMIDLKQNSKVDNRELKGQDRFNWSEEEKLGFLNKYHEKVVSEANYLPGAKQILKQLKKEGHTLIVITARGKSNEKIVEITKQRLKQDDMEIFDKYYFKTENKAEVCVKENIDIMIDDWNVICEATAKEKIHTIYLKDAPSYDIKDNEYVTTLYNWGEIYRYLEEIFGTAE